MRADDWLVNHKKIQRRWRDEGRRVPVRRRRKKPKNRHAGSAPVAAAPNAVWAIDFCFDAPLETELIAQSRWHTLAEARSVLFIFGERFSNPHRRQSALGYLSPVAFEKEYDLQRVVA
jgi:transposase InsO family protein